MTAAPRAVALALLAVALLLVWFGLVQPLRQATAAMQARAAESERLVARAQGAIVEDTAIRERIARLKNGTDLAGTDHLVAGGSEAQATAALQDHVKQVLASSGSPLLSFQPLAAEPADGLRRIGLRVEFSASTAGLQQVLHALEGGKPAILVESLFVRVRGNEFRNMPDPLDVTLEIVGYDRGG